jgi:AraC-like DNA-binding protein
MKIGLKLLKKGIELLTSRVPALVERSSTGELICQLRYRLSAELSLVGVQCSFAIMQISMELLSDVVSSLKPAIYIAPSLDVGVDWAIQFPAGQGVKFDVVLQGSCWIQVEGNPHPHNLHQGDCFLLTSGRSFLAGSDLTFPATDARAVFTNGCDSVVRHQGGGDLFLVGGRFGFMEQYADSLFRSLPPIIISRTDSEEASALRSSLDLFVKELRGGKPGSLLSVQNLAHLMLIQMLRLYLDSDHALETGWWSALRDTQLRSTLSAMHEHPARPWTLSELARIATMSRSSFANKFKRVVGEAPLEYLTRRRMRVAAQLLNSTMLNVLEIANEVGYTSESAFSTAFRKYWGEAPRDFRKKQLIGVGQIETLANR